MKTEYLTYIKEIAKYGSFNKAAQNLYMSQPALNEAVSSLERELGFKIFQRTHKGVFLTSEGENMFKSIDLVLNTIKSWQDFSTKNKQNNSINIKTFSTVGRIVLSDLIDEMQKNNPQLSIHVYGQFYGDADGLINEIFLQENYDLVILGITAQVLPKMVDFLPIIKKQMKILFHDQYYVVMNANHPLAKKKSLKLKDLTDNILVTHSSNKTPTECIKFFKNFLPKNQYVYLESNVDILTYLKKEKTFSFFPQMFLRYEENVLKGELVVKPLEDYYFAIEHCLFYPEDEFSSAANRKLVNAIEAKYQTLKNKFNQEPLL